MVAAGLCASKRKSTEVQKLAEVSYRESTMNRCLPAGVFCLAVGTAGLIAVLVLYYGSKPEDFAYGVQFDAGSTKTRMYVYRWPASKTNNTAVLEQLTSCLVLGGSLSGFATLPDQAGPSLESCLSTAKSLVPQRLIQSTPVYLGATAGMRLLSATNATAAQLILASVRDTLKSSGFMMTNAAEQARIITGQEEGVGDWVTVNYVLGNLGATFKTGSVQLSSTASKTVGTLDLGGASTQIAFVDESPSNTPQNYSKDVVLYAYNYKLYTYSFMCYGLNEAIGRHYAELAAASETTIVSDPCFPAGYVVNFTRASLFSSYCTSSRQPSNAMPVYTFHGTGNSAECANSIKSMFDFTSCTFWNCSFNGAFMPLASGRNYAAFAGYYYVVNDLGFFNSQKPPGVFTRTQYLNATNVWCSRPWSQYGAADPSLCTKANYIYTILTDGYKFGEADWSSLRFANSANGTDFGWTVGYMLNQTTYLSSVMSSSTWSIGEAAFGISVAIAAVFLVVGISFLWYGAYTVRRRGRYEQRV